MSLTRTQAHTQTPRSSNSSGQLSTGNAPQGGQTSLRIRPTFRGGRTLILDMPIGQRLTIGFLLAALIATLVASLIGVQRSQSLSRQSEFYQDLLRTNTSLTTGANFLQLMNTEAGALIEDANAPQPSEETIKQDETALLGLIDRYETTLKTYVSQDLVSNHSSQVALLEEANKGEQVQQQETMAASAQRTWQVYRISLEQIITSVKAGNIAEAQTFSRVQAEPTNGDAISALRALIHLNQKLSDSINIASAVEEQQQLITTIVGSLLAFIAISLVGWFISGTIVRRLKRLLHVTQAVERGDMLARVEVVGRDEIGSVSASTNAMLNAISDLFTETRLQRDALTNAAEHLFTNMRVVNAGDLRINASVNNDPIGLLASAFNFTVGRFRRFVLRVQTMTEQLDAASRYEVERAEHFVTILNSFDPAQQIPTRKGEEKPLSPQASEAVNKIKRLYEHVHNLSDENHQKRLQAIQTSNEQIIQVIDRLQQVLAHDGGNRNTSAPSPISNSRAAMLTHDLRMLELQTQNMYKDLQHTQWERSQRFLEMEKELNQALKAVQALDKAQGALHSLSAEEQEELLHAGHLFVSDVLSMSRKLHALSQEVRVNMISFQLDGSEEVMPQRHMDNQRLRHAPGSIHHSHSHRQ
ncbi:MCP four helix bundle domain-containing protein [Ktedonospora formicarum]|uniref:HAMP domain-containing protein n=1 Tax=Ktedonospora formicarum TaxID=2778364 RepID=A0A8J3HZI6_9CHLR|nr:MCP four helix bundle domain-containing protein [Ktedonospora formicarum]GHO43868.1 hypothetical protein KSX_20310 [Ktedonospora formicarum]